MDAAQIIVIDGDTIEALGQRWRLTGMDTPEIFRPHCPAERRVGLRAKARLQSMLHSADRIELRPELCRTHNYGRLCGSLLINGQAVAPVLIREGLAGAERKNWCSWWRW